ncbi:MAG: RtcB family protein [Desulfovibrio sp.]
MPKKKKHTPPPAPKFTPRPVPAPWKQWGEDLDPQAIQQMQDSCELPVAIRGALMPDAHVGYGLPIGGVLAVKNAVIPWAVGMDIACRMRMSILDMPLSTLSTEKFMLKEILETNTCFGVGGTCTPAKDHAVMAKNWNFSPVLKKAKRKAWAQLGTSGSGNHFVELGVLTLKKDMEDPRTKSTLVAGEYTALLSHSGSRGLGGEVARYYSKKAQEIHPELPKKLQHLAWLDINSDLGKEYWRAMELIGEYSAANHEIIHKDIIDAMDCKSIFTVENHHNFAFKEKLDGEEVIIHRKGATPAHEGTLGIIPGAMNTPAYVVEGKGNKNALNSAAHGAGRSMSRKQALKTFVGQKLHSRMADQGIELIGGGLDESPEAYKDIHTVMEAQQDLVDIIAEFNPRIVKMA